MGTMTGQDAPDDAATRQAEMRRRMAAGGPAAVAALVADVPDLAERRALYALAQRTFGPRAGPGAASLDDLVALVRLGIADCLGQDMDGAADGTAAANVLSFNLAADLAPCWPDDELPRERRHFEAGLVAAEDCLRWRRALGKPPAAFALAHWAHGIHLLALGRPAAAANAFGQALAASVQSLPEHASPRVEPGGSFFVILNDGYLGLAQAMAGEKKGRARFGAACRAFVETSPDRFPDAAEDAAFGLAQLRTAARRLAGWSV